ncbi:hypothetical protein [Nitrospira sp.]|uniref:hypothetical protein n=1 Tax=Nitrospira sp. TaxID=70125 RepID=UPI003FCC3CE5
MNKFENSAKSLDGKFGIFQSVSQGDAQYGHPPSNSSAHQRPDHSDRWLTV